MNNMGSSFWLYSVGFVRAMGFQHHLCEMYQMLVWSDCPVSPVVVFVSRHTHGKHLLRGQNIRRTHSNCSPHIDYTPRCVGAGVETALRTVLHVRTVSICKFVESVFGVVHLSLATVSIAMVPLAQLCDFA